MRALPVFCFSALMLFAGRASATRPNGVEIVRLLGPHAEHAFAPASGQIGALVAIPSGQSAAELGLEEIAPGIGRIRANAAGLLAYADKHPGLSFEVSPPLHMLLDRAGSYVRGAIARVNFHVDGTGVLVGVADTGLDVTHPDMLDADGKTRVAWLIDLSKPPRGVWPELEAKYGVKNAAGVISNGAVFNADDINAVLAMQLQAPHDEVGHGTHVTSIAAGNGGKRRLYGGIAPSATLVVARVTRSAADAIDNDDLLRGVSFIYDRADFLKQPVVVNLSLGGDYGPHDGTALWEKALASFVGPTHPGRALVVAAGNSGSILETPVHQSVRVTKGTKMRVPVNTHGADNGGVDIWVSMRGGATVDIGLEGPDGEWIAPVSNGSQRGKNTADYTSGVFNGQTSGTPIPSDSHGGVVIWQGKWPSGTYYVTLAGEGTVDLFMQASGDAASTRPAGFAVGVREGTINLPATHPGIIAVGCTVNRTKWLSITNVPVALHVPLLDGVGGFQDPSKATRELAEGEVCWFSSAGPTVTGVPKPEISAPGGIVVAAMSNQARPGGIGSIFTTENCPGPAGAKPDIRCFQVDSTHAVAVGTSMSSPMVAGAVALLFQRDPTLTQDKIVALLQAGAHPFRGAAPFEDQGGPGELDVLGSLDALDQMQNPTLHMPSPDKSWVTLSADYAAADGSTPFTVIVELRTELGNHRADMFDPARLQPIALIDGVPLDVPPTLVRHAPGVWFFDVAVPVGLGGSSLSVGAAFDGQDIVARKTVPVGADIWTADYPSHARGGCSCDLSERSGSEKTALALGAALALAFVRRRHRSHPRGASVS